MILPAQEIHVWLAFDHEFEDEALLSSVADLLQPDERAMAARRRARHLSRQYTITRALQRLALSRYAPQVAPADWRFTVSAQGKPTVAEQFQVCGLHFNIAHTAKLIAVAVARHPMLGVDVEHTTRRAPLAVTARYFTKAEADDLAALPEERRSQRFFALWTLKESWLKATGAGLSGGLGNVAFEFADELCARELRMRTDDVAQWQFWQAWPSSEHLLALAVRATGSVERVRMFRWRAGVGFAGEEVEQLRPVR